MQPLNSASACHLRALVVVVVGVAAVLVGAPTAATALSCASHPNASPKAVAEGTDHLSVDATFQEHYDGAIFGTVLSMRTENDGSQPDYGRTEVVLDVTGTFGPQVDSPAVIIQDDPGWLNGYPFEDGTHYFIPYVENEKGRYSHLCDPIAEIDATDVPELVELAEQNAWARAGNNDHNSGPSKAAGNDQLPAEPAAPAGASFDVGQLRPAGLVGLLALGAVAAAVWVRRKIREVKTASRSTD